MKESVIMKNVAYYNGRIAPLEELMIPANDRAVYFGDGVYDATYAVGRVIFAVDEHIERFMNSCRMLMIDPQITREELKKTLYMLVDLADDDDTCIYWQASRATAPRAHVFPEEPKTNLLVTVRPFKLADTTKRMKLITTEDNRYYLCNIKTINLLPNVLASEKAKRAGCNEAVFIRDGYVTECSHCNISILKNGVFKTAPLNNLILPGITRAHIIALCKELSIPVVEEAFTKEELMDADEVIISSSSVHGAAACEIDGIAVGGKDTETFEKIRLAYRDKLLRETRSR